VKQPLERVRKTRMNTPSGNKGKGGQEKKKARNHVEGA